MSETPFVESTVTGSKLWITVGLMCAVLMAVLDISIVNVALSDIRASFGTPLDQIAWVSTGYMMANIVVIPMTGWLQRRFGFKRYFTASILLFTLSSALCGLAWNLPSLVFFRVLQGCGGGAIIPTSQAILFARYPRQEHGMASALFGLGAVTGPLLGPTLGGYLIEVSSWHWMFFINIPFGLLAAGLVYRHVEEPGFIPDTRPLDRFGFVLLLVGMAALQYVLEEGNREGWSESPLILVLGCVAAIALVTLVVHVLEAEDPIVDLRVFLNRNYSLCTGVNFLLGTSMFSGTFLYSLYCGSVMHYTALDIGLLFLKGSSIQVPLMILIGRMGSRFDGRMLVALGITGNVVSLWMNAHLGPQADSSTMLQPLFVRASSLGLVFVPMSVLGLSDIGPRQRGNAAGLFNLTRELGGSIGTAWMSAQLNQRTHESAAVLREHVDIYNPFAIEQLIVMRGVLARTWDSERAALRAMDLRVAQQALVRAFNEDFMVITGVFAAALVLVALMRKPAAHGAAPVDAH